MSFDSAILGRDISLFDQWIIRKYHFIIFSDFGFGPAKPIKFSAPFHAASPRRRGRFEIDLRTPGHSIRLLMQQGIRVRVLQWIFRHFTLGIAEFMFLFRKQKLRIDSRSRHGSPHGQSKTPKSATTKPAKSEPAKPLREIELAVDNSPLVIYSTPTPPSTPNMAQVEQRRHSARIRSSSARTACAGAVEARFGDFEMASLSPLPDVCPPARLNFEESVLAIAARTEIMGCVRGSISQCTSSINQSVNQSIFYKRLTIS